MRRLSILIGLSVLAATGLVFLLAYAGMSVIHQRALMAETEERTREVTHALLAGLSILMQDGGRRGRLDEYVAAFDTAEARRLGYRIRIDDVSGRATSRTPGQAVSPVDRHLDADVRTAARTGASTTTRTDDVVRVLRPVAATSACLRCHVRASAGQVLGVIDVTHDLSDHLRAFSRRGFLVFAVLAPVPVLAAVLVSGLLHRRFTQTLVVAREELQRVADEAQSGVTDRRTVDFGVKALNALYGACADFVRDRERLRASCEALERDLRQVQKIESIGRLAGGVAHDFNNMLGVILGQTEMALEEMHPQDPLREGLEQVRRAAERSATLTRQLLAFARRQPARPTVIDLNGAVQSMLAMIGRLIGGRIAVDWRPCEALPPVKIDPAQIDQVLANLCVNARDAIAGSGTITIDTGEADLDAAACATRAGVQPGRFVTLAVHDDGCGMDSETLANVFEPFFTTKGLGKGTGLGLATVYGIVSQNGGFVDVRSEPGAGSTFTVHLPACPRAVARPAIPPEDEAAEGRGTVLLVEDEPALLRLTESALRALGYHVLPAGTPDEALRIAEAHAGDIDLLMTDVIMPGMNGRQLAERVQAAWPHVKCLYTSGYPAELIADHGVLAHGIAFLAKPWTSRDLAAKLREVLNRT